MKRALSQLSLVLAGFVSVGALLHASAAEPEKPKAGASKPKTKAGGAKENPGLPAPDYLPESARALLRKKMARHGQDARDLMFGVTLLRYDVARAAAQHIASEPRLERPEAGGEDEPTAFLPERFFVLQDEVRRRAQALAAAAEKKDDAAIAESYGLLMQTCVSCHSAYLKRE
ncbi:cytochrome c [Archangium gephyra]|uniref:cytochrome c n=1 Tax=Archangium gephyra TaxID=48 RepID=UPI0035D4BD84